MADPVRVRIRSYRVGFGDCFLLSFEYARGDAKHVLIDFGSTHQPKPRPKDLLGVIAEDIAARTGGKLTAVVATHRHKDHIYGFRRRKDGTGPGKVIRELKPDLVLQPWTEQPDLPAAALGPAPLPDVGPAAASRWRSINSLERVARSALQELRQDSQNERLSKRAAQQIEFIGDDNLTNRPAVENLASMATADGGQRYLKYGDDTGLEALIPGLSVDVLGPPTPEQRPDVLRQRSKDQDEFWHLQSWAGRRASHDYTNPLFAKGHIATKDSAAAGGELEHREHTLPWDARWFAQRLQRARTRQLLGIVRAMDAAMNNTSLILLFTVGDVRLLFPGDAQIENWLHVLEDAPEDERRRLHDALAETRVYKVGHHGSLNATPKSLWKLFDRRGDEPDSPGRLISLNSTKPGAHGHGHSGTEVPRKKLVAELRAESEYITTETLTTRKSLFHEVEIEVATGRAVQRTNLDG